MRSRDGTDRPRLDSRLKSQPPVDSLWIHLPKKRQAKHSSSVGLVELGALLGRTTIAGDEDALASLLAGEEVLAGIHPDLADATAATRGATCFEL